MVHFGLNTVNTPNDWQQIILAGGIQEELHGIGVQLDLRKTKALDTYCITICQHSRHLKHVSRRRCFYLEAFSRSIFLDMMVLEDSDATGNNW